jgi:hypothetical protein
MSPVHQEVHNCARKDSAGQHLKHGMAKFLARGSDSAQCRAALGRVNSVNCDKWKENIQTSCLLTLKPVAHIQWKSLLERSCHLAHFALQPKCQRVSSLSVLSQCTTGMRAPCCIITSMSTSHTRPLASLPKLHQLCHSASLIVPTLRLQCHVSRLKAGLAGEGGTLTDDVMEK